MIALRAGAVSRVASRTDTSGTASRRLTKSGAGPPPRRQRRHCSTPTTPSRNASAHATSPLDGRDGLGHTLPGGVLKFVRRLARCGRAGRTASSDMAPAAYGAGHLGLSPPAGATLRWKHPASGWLWRDEPPGPCTGAAHEQQPSESAISRPRRIVSSVTTPPSLGVKLRAMATPVAMMATGVAVALSFTMIVVCYDMGKLWPSGSLQ